jgi:hypothetical protein
MSRLFFSLLLGLSLAFGATASAWAAQDCPYKAAPAAHDCCPDDPASAMNDMADYDAPAQPDAPAKTCQLGQACRASVALAPLLQSIPVVAEITEWRQVDRRDVREPASPLFAFWRPPRIV